MPTGSIYLGSCNLPVGNLFSWYFCTYELFHFINNHSIENEYETLKSEEEVHQEFRQEFPDYFELLEKISKSMD